jgi:hypothetical protein
VLNAIPERNEADPEMKDRGKFRSERKNPQRTASPRALIPAIEELVVGI